jgi:hypothetical protein
MLFKYERDFVDAKMIQKNRARTQSRKQDYDYVESHGVGYEKRGGKWQHFNCAFSGYHAGGNRVENHHHENITR